MSELRPLKKWLKMVKISFFWISLKILKIEYHTKKKKCPVVNFTSVHQIWLNLVDKWLWKWANNSFQSAKFTNVQFVGMLLKPFTLWYRYETWQKLSSYHTDLKKCMKPVWKFKIATKIQDGRQKFQFFYINSSCFFKLIPIKEENLYIRISWTCWEKIKSIKK